MPFNELIDFHRREGGVLTIATHERPVPVDLGVLETDAGNRVLRYVEKPTLHYRVSMGVYVLEPSALAHIPDRTHFDFPDLVHALLDADCKVVGYPSNHFWLDIGRHEDYEAAVDAFETRRGEFGFE
jgi:NDP-sugar pyrophosphorylase family protein